MLHKAFSIEVNPDTAELERLSEATTLTKRVIQVWFQNARARHKKFLTANASPVGSSCGPSSSNDESMCNQFTSLVP